MKELHGLSMDNINTLLTEGYIKDQSGVIENGVLSNKEKAYTICFDTSDEQHLAYMRIFQNQHEKNPGSTTEKSIKFYDMETVIIEDAFAFDKIFEFALKHNFNICYKNTHCTRALEDIAKIQAAGYHIKIKTKKNISPDKKYELTPDIYVLCTKHPIITIQEYNKKYISEIDRASLCCDWRHIGNTLYKCDDHDGAVEQLQNGLGWSPEVTKTIHKALKCYKEYLYSCFPE